MTDAKRRLRQRVRDLFSDEDDLDEALDAIDALTDEEAEDALDGLRPLFDEIERAMAEERDAAKKRRD